MIARQRGARGLRWGVFAVVAACAVTAAAAAAEPAAESPDKSKGPPPSLAATPAADASPAGVGRHARGHHGGATIDSRMAVLAKELNLDAAQQAGVRKVLERQRQQVARAWSDESVPSAVRVKMTQSIGESAAEQIRAVLNDEQRQKYIKPRERESAVGSAGADVEKWMQSTKSK